MGTEVFLFYGAKGICTTNPPVFGKLGLSLFNILALFHALPNLWNVCSAPIDFPTQELQNFHKVLENTKNSTGETSTPVHVVIPWNTRAIYIQFT